MKARAEQDVRNAALDLTASAQQVRVADSNRASRPTRMLQSRDRFRAGVADTVEVVQAQESVASAEQDYISALLRTISRKSALARAIGQTEQGIVAPIHGK